MNFQQLQARVADFVNRDDLSGIIPDAINEAKDDFEATNRVDYMLARSAPTISNSYYLAIPTGYLETKHLKATASDNTIYTLQKNTEAFAMETFKFGDTGGGYPALFATQTDQLLFLIRPDLSATYTWELLYYKRSTDLSAAGDTNWLTNNYPWILIYGAIRVLAPYLGDDARIPIWEQKYQQWVAKLIKADNQENWNGSVQYVKPMVAEGI